MSEKTLPAVRQAKLSPIDRTREMRWLEGHRGEFAGQWVALDGDRLISHGAEPRQVFAAAREAGVARPLVIHVQKEAEPFTGGWL